MDMLVISSREFRDNQKSYLDQIDNGVEILIQRGRNKSYKITPIKENETLMDKETLYAKIESSIQQIKVGKSTTLTTKEEIHSFLQDL